MDRATSGSHSCRRARQAKVIAQAGQAELAQPPSRRERATTASRLVRLGRRVGPATPVLARLAATARPLHWTPTDDPATPGRARTRPLDSPARSPLRSAHAPHDRPPRPALRSLDPPADLAGAARRAESTADYRDTVPTSAGLLLRAAFRGLLSTRRGSWTRGMIRNALPQSSILHLSPYRLCT